MSLFCRILQASDLDEIFEFEQKKLAEQIPDEAERMVAHWNSRWRKEALEHYAPMGWSFLARDPQIKSERSAEGELVGYFIAQPLLFFQGQTQNLWVEHLAYTSLQARDELCDLAYRLSREKHFQRVFFPNYSGLQNSLAAYRAELWQSDAWMIKTTKSN